MLKLSVFIIIVSFCDCFTVQRLKDGDIFPNPYVASCSHNGCGQLQANLKGCLRCQCYSGYTYRSDYNTCIGHDIRQHFGCDFRFKTSNNNIASAMDIFDLGNNDDDEVDLPDIKYLQAKHGERYKSCNILENKSEYLKMGQWEHLWITASQSDFTFEIKNSVVKGMKFSGSNSSLYEGLVLKLWIKCITKSRKNRNSITRDSCLMFKIKGTKTWPDTTPKGTTPTPVITNSQPSIPMTNNTEEHIPTNLPTSGEKGKNISNKNNSMTVIVAVTSVVTLTVCLVVSVIIYCYIQRRRTSSSRSNVRRANELDGDYSSVEPMTATNDNTGISNLVYATPGPIYAKANSGNAEYVSAEASSRSSTDNKNLLGGPVQSRTGYMPLNQDKRNQYQPLSGVETNKHGEKNSDDGYVEFLSEEQLLLLKQTTPKINEGAASPVYGETENHEDSVPVHSYSGGDHMYQDLNNKPDNPQIYQGLLSEGIESKVYESLA